MESKAATRVIGSGDAVYILKDRGRVREDQGSRTMDDAVAA